MKDGLSVSLADAIKIADPIITGMTELASITRGGGHFNLNPDNILVGEAEGEERRVYVVGTGRIGQPIQGAAPFTDEGFDPMYRAPETLVGTYTKASDVYSVGMIVLNLLAGADAGTDTSLAPEECNQMIWERADKALRTSVKIVLRKATSVSPGARFGNMDKLRTFLRRVAGAELGCTTVKEPAYDTGRTRQAEEADARPKIKQNQDAGADGAKALDQVAGMASLKAALRRNFVDIVRHSEMAAIYGITPPNGILLYGAPGCGKTYVAEKAAQESGLKYQIIRPSDLGSVYIHGSQAKIADTFKQAEANAPMILIFDEFDAIAPRRDSGNGNQANEVNEILTQMNNCADRGIYVLALTNRPDMIDAAVLRAGRLDEKFYVGLPDTDARREIFALELKNRPCADDIDLSRLSDATANFTCGDISYMVKEAARQCFDEAIKCGSKQPVPLTQQRLLELAAKSVPSVSPKQLRMYDQLKEKMEHRDRENKARPEVGFNI